MNRINSLILWTFVLSLPVIGQIPDTSNSLSYLLDSVVVSTDRILSNANDAPTSIEIISYNKLMKSNGESLSDMLKTSVKVNIKSYGNSPYLNSITMNGSSAEQTLVLLDGVPMNSSQNSMLDLSTIPAQFFNSIEIVNSGMSSLYGSNSIGGLINLNSETKFFPKGNKKYNIGLTAGYGSYNKHLLGFDLSGKIGDIIAADVYFNYEKSDDDFEFYYDNGVEKERKRKKFTGYENIEVGSSIAAEIDSSLKIKLTSFFVDHDKKLPGIETGNAPVKSTQRDRNFTNILSVRKFISNTFVLKAAANYQNNLMNYLSEPLTDSQHKNQVYGFHIQSENSADWITLLAAYDYSKFLLNSSEADGEPKRNNNAFTLAANSNIVKQISLSSSIRYDSFSDINKNVTTANAGFNIQPFKDIGLKVRGNAGNNFRAPSFNDMYWKVSGNRDLKSERSINAECGLLYLLPEIWNSRFDFSFTYIETNDKILWLPQKGTAIWSPVNIEESASRNFTIVYAISEKLGNLKFDADAGLSFNRTIKIGARFKSDPTTGKQLPYIPLNSAKLNLMLECSGVGLNMFYSYTGPRFRDSENKTPLNPFQTVDMNITYDNELFNLNYRAKFEINNLFNSDYQVVAGYPMPLRNFLLTIQLTY